MILSTEDNGVIWSEENDGREISIVSNKENPSTLYYVAKDAIDTYNSQFRSAGIVENLTGITSLMYWVNGGEWDATGLIEGKNRA